MFRANSPSIPRTEFSPLVNKPAVIIPSKVGPGQSLGTVWAKRKVMARLSSCQASNIGNLILRLCKVEAKSRQKGRMGKVWALPLPCPNLAYIKLL